MQLWDPSTTIIMGMLGGGRPTYHVLCVSCSTASTHFIASSVIEFPSEKCDLDDPWKALSLYTAPYFGEVKRRFRGADDDICTPHN